MPHRIPRTPIDEAPYGVLNTVPNLTRAGIEIVDQALTEAGFPLGEHDRRIASWLGQFDAVTAVTVASWIVRAYDAGRAAAQAQVSTTVDRRYNLTGHTVTVETLDERTAREVNQPHAAGQLAVVERHDGRLGKVCCVQADVSGTTIEQVARNYARTYGARYVGGAE